MSRPDIFGSTEEELQQVRQCLAVYGYKDEAFYKVVQHLICGSAGAHDVFLGLFVFVGGRMEHIVGHVAHGRSW